MKPLHVVREISISYSYGAKPSELPKVGCSEDAYKLFISSWDVDKIEFIEQFRVMLLSRWNRVLGIVDLSSGGVHGTVVDLKVLFGCALKANASGIILAHNHPSGNVMPSQSDIVIAKKINEAGTILEVQVLDHLIIVADGYYSFAEQEKSFIK